MSTQLVRKVASFGIVGGGVFVFVQAMLFALVDGLYWDPAVANITVLSLSVWINYKLNQRYTWNMSTGDAQAKRFVIARVSTMLLSFIVFNLLVSAGIYYLIANAIGVAVGMVVNFVAADQWVFRAGGKHRERPDPKLDLQTFATIMFCLAIVVLVLRFGAAQLFLPLILVLLSLVSLLVATLFLVSLLYVHRHSTAHLSLKLPVPTGEFRETFAVLMPARKELSVYPHTILNAAWTQRQHPSHRFFPVICDDDPDTIRVAIAATRVVNDWKCRGSQDDISVLERQLHSHLSRLRLRGSPLSDDEKLLIEQWRESDALIQIIIFPLGTNKPSKPRQLNYAFELLEDAGYTAGTILDAESQAQEGLFTHVDQAFQDHPDVSIIQGAVQLMNPVFQGTHTQVLRQAFKRWYAWHNLLEYYRWFSGQMSFQSDNDFVPLGGNTVFIKMALLKLTRGWPLTLTEDCALGVLACAKFKARVLTFYDPLLATQEETPPSYKDLVKQRTRWTQGFLQSFLAGEWRTLPSRRQRLLALWILSSPFFQAISALLVPFTLVMMSFGLIKSPPGLVLVMYVPLLAMVGVTILQLKQLHEYGKSYGRKVPWYIHVQVVVTQAPYQWLLSYAALRALFRHYNGQIDWQSPARAGDLLVPQAAIVEATS